MVVLEFMFWEKRFKLVAFEMMRRMNTHIAALKLRN